MITTQDLQSDIGKSKEIEESMALLEAALYVAGRPLNLKTLKSIVKKGSKKKIQMLTRMLAQRYLNRKGALELIELDDGRFVLQLKPNFVPYVKRLSIRPLLSRSPLKTLAYIAYRQPITQAYLAAVRGSHVYTHVKKLRNLGLITTEKLGRTKIIRTTNVFADYFNLSHNPSLMRRQLKSLFDTVDKD